MQVFQIAPSIEYEDNNFQNDIISKKSIKNKEDKKNEEIEEVEEVEGQDNI